MEDEGQVRLEGLWFVDMSERAKLRFSGPQALWFLDQLVTNKVDELPPESGREALLLSPHGRITSHLRVLHRRDSEGAPDVFVDAPPGHGPQLLDFFGMRVFATKVTISDLSGEYAIVRIMGADAAPAAGRALGVDLTGLKEHDNAGFAVDAAGGVAVRVVLPFGGFDLWVPAGSGKDIIERLGSAGAKPLPPGDYESLRVGSGVPVFGIDFDEGYLPQEAALERSVHFAKGCYLGQEAVAMAQRGRIKRRLRHLEFEGRGWTGNAVYEGKPAGRVTSAALSGGKWFGIGTIKTEIPAGARVDVLEGNEEVPPGGEGVARADVKELPGTTYGPTVPSARELREKLQGR